MRAFKKPFQDLRLTRLEADRSHAIAGAMVRVYFQLSEPSPLGWSYLFTTVWQAAAYPAKCPAGVEGNAIWIACRPDDAEIHHLEQLERAVAQTNAKYKETAALQALKASRQAELNTQLQLRLNDLNRTLYPACELTGSASVPPRLLAADTPQPWRDFSSRTIDGKATLKPKFFVPKAANVEHIVTALRGAKTMPFIALSGKREGHPAICEKLSRFCK